MSFPPRGAAVALMGLASAMPLYAGAHASRLLGDDAFITLTYARSLAAGEGFTYHGSTVLGTTTPLLAMILGGLLRLRPGTDPADLAVWVGAAAWLATGWLVFAGRRSLGLDLWPATAMAVLTLLAGWIHALGMEAHLFALLLTMAVVLGLGGRWLAAGVACGLLTICRGEGLLLLPILALAAVAAPWLRSAGRPRSSPAIRSVALLAGGSLIVLVPWAVYAMDAFSSPVPATLSAKVAQAESGMWEPFAPELGQRWLPLWASAWGPAHPAVANPVWWMVAMGLAWAAVRDFAMLVPAAWMLAYVAAYTALGVPSYPWYGLPVMFVLQWQAALGAARLRDLPWPRPPGGRLRLVASVVAVAFLWVGAAVPRASAVRRDAGDERAPSYLGLAGWLSENVPAEETVAFIEVGYLGYFAPNPVVDLAGLVTPGVAEHVRQGDFATGFFALTPDVFVHLSDFDWALGAILADPRFDALYEPVASLPGPRDAPLVVYRLRESPSP